MLIDKKFVKEKSSYMFIEFLKSNDQYKSIAFFRRSPAGWLLMHKIMEHYSSDEHLYVEQLIKEIPHKLSSRLSAFAIIDDAVKRGILEKKNSNGDKRKREITPSLSFIDEYKEWLHSFSAQFDYKKKNGKESAKLESNKLK
jgi:hypothetical protein